MSEIPSTWPSAHDLFGVGDLLALGQLGPQIDGLAAGGLELVLRFGELGLELVVGVFLPAQTALENVELACAGTAGGQDHCPNQRCTEAAL